MKTNKFWFVMAAAAMLSGTTMMTSCEKEEEISKREVIESEVLDEGIFINPVIPPACAPQDTLVRVALMATHTVEQVDYAVEKLTKCFKELGIIK